MDFTLYTTAGGAQTFSGEARYSLTEQGILVIWTKSRKFTYAPAGWLYIDEATQPESGSVASPAGVPFRIR